VGCRPALMERALANLVHNGIVHGSSDVGMVLRAEPDHFVVTVHSAGPVLDPEVVAGLARRDLDQPIHPPGPAAVRAAGWASRSSTELRAAPASTSGSRGPPREACG